jgi:hypothetical protein
MPPQNSSRDKELIDSACAALGITLEELGKKLRFKSIRRYRNGEFELTETKQQHIQDLIAIAKVCPPPTLSESSSNMPPHLEPEHSVLLREKPATYGVSSDFDFAACIKWISEIHENNPQAFRAAAQSIKAIYDMVKK